MKLKFELVNGYGVLVDEESDPFLLPVGKTVLHVEDGYRGFRKIEKDTILGFLLSGKRIYWEVIFAEKELNLEGVPVFEWRDFEVEKLASFHYGENRKTVEFEEGFRKGFKICYKSNPAKYTEEDLRKAIQLTLIDAEKSVMWSDIYHHHLSNKIIQSLQKYPKYVVMEREEKTVEEIQKELGIYGHDEGLSEREFEEYKKSKSIYKYKLFTNSEGKQQGTVKELIWE